MADNTVTKGLLIRFDALPGRESDVESFLDTGLPMVNEEPDTTAWFGIRLGPSTFGIFDVFPDESGRETHLGGPVAEALMGNVGEILAEPNIEQIDIVASKLPG